MPPVSKSLTTDSPVVDYTHTIDRWDEATGENLIELFGQRLHIVFSPGRAQPAPGALAPGLLSTRQVARSIEATLRPYG
jgi:hypothetical protein